ncbi:Cytochrome P450-like protein [Parafrankia sp. EAN1pec]|nr:Cytochrome P450-like protein [Frankia sp. EAN1pec]
MDLDEAGSVFTDPTAYADEKRWHTATALLRRHSPVHRVESAGFAPFWAVTRHEDVFTDPEAFDVGRTPNKHVGFGFGAHYCLGTHLARLEGRALYTELVPRLREVELAGTPEYMQTLFVGGPKHLPIRYTIT